MTLEGKVLEMSLGLKKKGSAMSRPTPVIVLLFKRECWGGCHTATAENSQESSNHQPPPAQVFAHLARSDEEKLVLREKGSRAVVSLR